MNLHKKTVLVTGAAGGIGQELVKQLALAGATVVATDANSDGLKEIEKAYGVTTLPHDVTSGKEWQKVLASLEGSLDCIINNAGVLQPAYVYNITEEQIDFQLNVNVKGVMLGTSMAADKMKKQGHGHIINIASLAGVAAIPGIAIYSATKFAVRGFSLAVASELKPHNVQVSVICPDAVKTPMLDLQLDYEEAAMTFSGGDGLGAKDIAEVIINTIGKAELEVLIPLSRGLLAKFSNLAPDLSSLLLEPLRHAGLRQQANLKK